MEFSIEKLIYGGDGLARLPADERGRGKSVFVPFVLEGERVEAALVEEKPGFARARLEQVSVASAHRTEPFCPYFVACGGCQYQHAAYSHQVQIKLGILTETLRRTAKIDLMQPPAAHTGQPWFYRNRSRLKVRGGADFALGYFRFRSNSLLPVEQCPISSPLINRALAAFWNLGRQGRMPESVLEAEFFANADDSALLVEFYLAADNLPEVQRFAGELRRQLPETRNLYAFRHRRHSEAGAGSSEPWLWAEEAGNFEYQTLHARYRVSGGSFFQSNRFLTDELISLVTDGESGEQALDLYAGVGLFSLPLGQTFRRVTAVEIAPFSVADLKTNAPTNVRAVRATAEHFLQQGEKGRPELVVVDPPRAGLGEQVVRSLVALAPPRLTYISCDPATLARDLSLLLAGGYSLAQLHLLDLFPQTFHIESVTKLVRR